LEWAQVPLYTARFDRFRNSSNLTVITSPQSWC
jgi:hypothetical protein